MELLTHYIVLADLFEYPDTAFPARIKKIHKKLQSTYPEAAKKMERFLAFTSEATLIEMQELYTRSFDVQAVTTLDIGYVLFGDDYKRGEMLVNLNREHRDAGNELHNCELSDHLPNVLRLIPKMKDEAVMTELVERMVGPAVYMMIEEFDPDKLNMKFKVYKKHHKTIIDRHPDYGILYRGVLKALYVVLNQDFELKLKEETEQTSDFLKSVNTEMEIEKD